MQSKFIVEGLGGRKTLSGTIEVGGAKNAVLKMMPASVLFSDTVSIEHVPAIEDVARITELLEAAGAHVARTASTLTIEQPEEWNPALDKKIAERLRASIVFTGPMLARTGRVSFPFPGGCVLGERSIDLFLSGFTAMGARVEEDDSFFTITAGAGGKLKGAHIFSPAVSVTATETLMLAAVLAEGETVLENAAMEPEIPHLAEFLNSCGARISGAGTSVIKIAGGGLLKAAGKPFVTPPDRIEAGSFLILAALVGKDVTVAKCEPKHMGALITLMQRMGVPLEVGGDYIKVVGGVPNSNFKLVSVRTHEYPGFPTDLQAPMAVLLSQASGESTILETIFDGRFRYTDDLVRMGADITVMNPHKILIRGPKPLTRKALESPDLRGGLAYIIAATVASGTSSIDNAYLIDRGYEHIEERLQKLGLNIKREVEA